MSGFITLLGCFTKKTPCRAIIVANRANEDDIHWSLAINTSTYGAVEYYAKLNSPWAMYGYGADDYYFGLLFKTTDKELIQCVHAGAGCLVKSDFECTYSRAFPVCADD